MIAQKNTQNAVMRKRGVQLLPLSCLLASLPVLAEQPKELPKASETMVVGMEMRRAGLAHHPAASPFKDLKPWPAPGYRAEDFPRTENLTSRFLALPIGALYTVEDADYIAQANTPSGTPLSPLSPGTPRPPLEWPPCQHS